jgi:hypothetical protein
MIEKDLKKLFKKYKFLKKKTLPDGVQCGTGWNSIITNMFQALADTNPPDNFVVTKVFSKVDTLRVQTTGGNNSTRFVIDEAIEQSEETCEACGNLKELQKCDKCIEPPEVQDPTAAMAAVTATPVVAPTCTCAPGACTCPTTNVAPTACTCPAGSCTCAPVAPAVPIPVAATATNTMTGQLPAVCTCVAGVNCCCQGGSCSCDTSTSSPADYYFKLFYDPNSSPTDWVAILPKAFQDTHSYWWDGGSDDIEPLLIANGFDSLDEAQFEFSGGDLKTIGRNLLLKLGFIENNNL